VVVPNIVGKGSCAGSRARASASDKLCDFAVRDRAGLARSLGSQWGDFLKRGCCGKDFGAPVPTPDATHARRTRPRCTWLRAAPPTGGAGPRRAMPASGGCCIREAP